MSSAGISHAAAGGSILAGDGNGPCVCVCLSATPVKQHCIHLLRMQVYN